MVENTSPEPSPSKRTGLAHAIRARWTQFLTWLAGRNSFLLVVVPFGIGFFADRIPLLAPYDWVFFLAGGLLPIVLSTVSTEDDGYEQEISQAERLTFIAGQLRWAVTPWGILTQFLQIGGNFVPYFRYLGRLPNRDRHRPETGLSLPFDGEWTTVNGGVTKETSHSWGLAAQRYAYDFVVTDEDRKTHEGDGTELTDYYAFGRPIAAPADGTVVATKESLRDYPKPGSGWIEWRTWDIVGNHVVIEHGDGEYSLLAHLKADSVTVERGDVVGACGNSGVSTEPHLHFQLQDNRNFWIAAGLVPSFDEADIERDDDKRADRSVYADEGDATYLWASDRVKSRGDSP